MATLLSKDIVEKVETSESEATSSEDEAEVADVDLAVSYRGEGMRQLTQPLVDEPPLVTKESWLTPNIKALILTSFLFTTITVVQVFAAKIANSLALLMDCISMGVDALTYMGNIFVECRKRDGSPHEGSQIIVCAISLGCLLYFTWDESRESMATIAACRGTSAAEEPDDVNGYITLAFGIGGVIFDILSLWAFYHSNRTWSSNVGYCVALCPYGADSIGNREVSEMTIPNHKFSSAVKRKAGRRPVREYVHSSLTCDGRFPALNVHGGDVHAHPRRRL